MEFGAEFYDFLKEVRSVDVHLHTYCCTKLWGDGFQNSSVDKPSDF